MTTLAPPLHGQNEHLYLLNDAGEVLVYVTNDTMEVAQDTDALSLVASATPNEWVTLGKDRFLPTIGETNSMRIVAMTSRTALDARIGALQGTFTLILLLDLVLVSILAYTTTKHICNQMLFMIDFFDAAMRGDPIERPTVRVRNEYDIIMNNIIYMYLKDNAVQKQMQEEKYQKEHAELMALQLQINPHFLYNTLQTLDISIRGGNHDRIDICDMIQDLSDILKYALSNPSQLVTLEEEIRSVKNYVAVQKFRFGNRFVVYYEISTSLMNCQVFRLMLQPLIENCLIHGLDGVSGRGYIWIRAEKIDDQLRISVKDSGVGMTEEKYQELIQRINDESSRSIGLVNLNRRLMLHYGAQNKLHITTKPGEGTEVAFMIPYDVSPIQELLFETIEDKT